MALLALAPFRSSTVVQVAAIAGRARDRRIRRSAIDSLTSTYTATAASPDWGWIAGSIPAGPAVHTRARPALTRRLGPDRDSC